MFKRATAGEVGFEFVAEFFDEGHHRHRGRVAQGAEGPAEHVFRDVVHQGDVALDAAAGVEAVEQLLQPRRTFTARDAPARAFVLVELHDALHRSDHAGVFIHDHDAPGAEHAADLRHRIVIHGDVALIGLHYGARRSAGNDSLQLLTVAHAAADLVDHAEQVVAHGQLVDARLVDVTGEADEPRAAVLRRTQRRKRRAAIANDGGDGAVGLDVVQHGRARPGAGDGGEGRLQAGYAALAFDGIEQRGLFTALVCAGSGVGVGVEIEARALDVLAEVTA